MIRFEDYLEQANGARSPEQLFQIFTKAMASYGFDKILLGLATDHKDIGLKAGIGVIKSFPDDWMKYYHQNSFHKIDPIVTYGVHQANAFVWGEIGKHVKLRPIQRKCLMLSEEAGLNNGITVPLRGEKFEIAGLSLASSNKKDACYFNEDLITAYCNHFYVAFKRIHVKPTSVHKNTFLTEKEKDILLWASTGISEDAIAGKLNCSRHTVNMRLRGIYQKLEANNRTLAIVKALMMGLVHF